MAREPQRPDILLLGCLRGLLGGLMCVPGTWRRGGCFVVLCVGLCLLCGWNWRLRGRGEVTSNIPASRVLGHNSLQQGGNGSPRPKHSQGSVDSKRPQTQPARHHSGNTVLLLQPGLCNQLSYPAFAKSHSFSSLAFTAVACIAAAAALALRSSSGRCCEVKHRHYPA